MIFFKTSQTVEKKGSHLFLKEVKVKESNGESFRGCIFTYILG